MENNNVLNYCELHNHGIVSKRRKITYVVSVDGVDCAFLGVYRHVLRYLRCLSNDILSRDVVVDVLDLESMSGVCFRPSDGIPNRLSLIRQL